MATGLFTQVGNGVVYHRDTMRWFCCAPAENFYPGYLVQTCGSCLSIYSKWTDYVDGATSINVNTRWNFNDHYPPNPLTLGQSTPNYSPNGATVQIRVDAVPQGGYGTRGYLAIYWYSN